MSYSGTFLLRRAEARLVQYQLGQQNGMMRGKVFFSENRFSLTCYSGYCGYSMICVTCKSPNPPIYGVAFLPFETTQLLIYRSF
jgi:hypothetical protein